MFKKYIVTLILFLSAACASPPLADPTPIDKLIYPISIELSQDENYLFVANTNFDLHYRNASLNVINLDDRKINKTSTVLTDNFLSNIVIDYGQNLLFTTSKEQKKLYLVDISDIDNLNCAGDNIESGAGLSEYCSNSSVLDLEQDAPNALTIDIDNQLIYIGHRNSGVISIIRYSKSDKNRLKLLKQFKIANFLGDISSLRYSKKDKKVYVTSTYSSFIYSFIPLFDYYNRVSSIKYFDKIRIMNRNIEYTPSSESFDFYKDKIVVATTSPQGVSILKNRVEKYNFSKSIPTVGAPVKVKCIEEDEICLLAMYDAKAISIIDPTTDILLKNINLKKRVYDFVYSSKRKELYATLFLENSILIIDMNKESSSYLKIKEVITNE